MIFASALCGIGLSPYRVEVHCADTGGSSPCRRAAQVDSMTVDQGSQQ